MVGLERRREVAVSTAAAIETNQVEPLRRRMSTERRDLSCAPEPPDHANDLGIREPVNGDRSFRTLAILCVVIAFCSRDLGRDALPASGSSHRGLSRRFV